MCRIFSELREGHNICEKYCKPGKFCSQEIFAVFAVGFNPQKLNAQNEKYQLTSLKN